MYKHNLLLALGDNAISLFLLNQINDDKYISGTKLTESVLDLCKFNNKFTFKYNFDNIPSFYNIKNESIYLVVGDFIKFYLIVKKEKEYINILEKKDFRSKILSFLTFKKIYAPNKNKNVYFDRKELIEKLYSQNIVLHYLSEYNNGNSIVINPTSRLEIKNIKIDELKFIIEILNKHEKEVTLIDYDGKYKELKKLVFLYYEKTELSFAIDLVKNCDFYIGADSFFIHLAYIFKKPFYIYFNFENEYFMPPFCLEKKNFIVSSSYNKKRLKYKVEEDLIYLNIIKEKNI